MTPSPLPPFDRSGAPGYRLRNAAQTVLLLGGMILLLAACGWIVAGLPGLVWAAVLGGFGLTLSARLSPRLAARMLGAMPIPAGELPEVREIVDALARRAQLRRAPQIYFISTPIMTALSMGNRHEAAITLSSGLIRGLSLRELTGVLAHEMSHVRHNDPWIMTLANIVRSLTGTMSFIGILLLFMNLPLMLAGGTPVPWLLVLLLTFAPTIGVLLQLALSRTREFDADLDAAGLTGDPAGLAAALEKLERREGQNWEAMLPGGRRGAIPTLLRSHPKTAERVQRLLALASEAPTPRLQIPAEPPHGTHSIIPDTPRRRPWPWRPWGPWG